MSKSEDLETKNWKTRSQIYGKEEIRRILRFYGNKSE